jgi:phytoene dehydrogenase-like protein
MTPVHDAIVIGGGVNGLVAGATLARHGLKVLLLERSPTLGGLAAPAEFAPGFRAAPLALDADWLPEAVARDLGLAPIGRTVPAVPLAVPAGEGAWLPVAASVGTAVEAIRRFAPGDAARWPGFVARAGRLAGFLEALYTLPPPDIDSTALADLLPLLGVGRKLRGLGRAGMIELLRVMPIAVQEYLDDEFTCDPLKAGVGAAGTTDLRQGPRSGGTAFVMLHHQVGAGGVIRGRGYWTGGAGVLVDALGDAARRLGVTIRCGAEVARVSARDDRVAGVVLESGEEIAGRSVLSSADPARTLLGMVDPVWLDPEFLLAVRNIKFRGSTAKVLYALEALPGFPGLPEPEDALRGVLSLSASLTEIEKAADAAKYGRVSERPHLELRMPSLRWPGLAPDGKHVLVATAQWAPYRLATGQWDAEQRAALGRAVTAGIERVAPGFQRMVREMVVGAPPDFEARFGLTEGALTQGELTLDQILFMRPVAGASRYETPLQGLYLCGAGAHPGPGVAGGPGWLAARQVLRHRRERRGAHS